MKLFIFLMCIVLSSCSDGEWASNYKHDNFVLNDRQCVVVHPQIKPNGKWIVRPAFIGAYSQVDDSLLARGYTVAFCDVTHEYGNSKAQRDFYDFYDFTKRKFGLNDKFIIEGFSRGGYFALSFSENYPDCIDKIYCDAPVCDLYSWPLKQDTILFQDAKRKWEECGISIDSIHDNPVKKFTNILEIPLIIVYGDSDDIVPYHENFGRIDIQKHKRISIIKKKGIGHHPHSLIPCDTIVNFLTK